MKQKRLISKNAALLILVVLVICTIATILLSYNKFTAAKISVGFEIPLALLIILISGIVLFLFYTSGVEQIKLQREEIESKKAELNKALRSKQKDNSQSKTDDKIDIDGLLAKIIPNIDAQNIEKYGETMLTNISQCVDIVQGTLHMLDTEDELFKQIAGYAFYTEGETASYRIGETLAGQVAKNQEILNLDKVPDNYITVMSGLGNASPKNLLIVPVISPNKQTIGIIEVAAFKPFNNQVEELFAKLGNKLGEIIVTTSQNKEVV